jgi:hypothetical protein
MKGRVAHVVEVSMLLSLNPAFWEANAGTGWRTGLRQMLTMKTAGKMAALRLADGADEIG